MRDVFLIGALIEILVRVVFWDFELSSGSFLIGTLSKILV